MTGEDILIVNALLHDKVNSIAHKEASTQYSAYSQHLNDNFDSAGLDHEVHARLEEVSESKGPDQKAQQLSKEENQKVSIVPHESFTDDLACRQDDSKREHLHSVAFKNAKAPPFVDLLVHDTV